MDKRKELKQAFKQITPPMGVYQIKNTVNGKIFIDSSMNLKGNLNRYRTQLEFMVYHNRAIKEDLALHGPDAFTAEILETLDPEKIPESDRQDAVKALAEKWLNNLQPYGDRGYNREKKTKEDKG